jgi:nucleoid DNA-binding protein
MNRSDLILKLAEQYPQYTAKDIEQVVMVILDSMTGTQRVAELKCVTPVPFA